ncbi:hypothetical protein ACOMHN_054091 [Nucella lapillus]
MITKLGEMITKLGEKSAASSFANVSDGLDSSTSDSPDQQTKVSGVGPEASTSSKPPGSSFSKESGRTSTSSGDVPLLSNSSNLESGVGSFSIPSFTDNKYQVPVAEEQPEQYVTAHEKDPVQALGSSLLFGPDTGAVGLPAYLPTPKTPSLPIPEPPKDDAGIPVYQPTPKRELKRRHKDKVQTKKAKSADLEYDPECNYSCGGLIGLPQDHCQIKKDAVNYRPSEKKARLSGSLKNRSRSRLSCESLIAGSPSDPVEDEELPEGEFSEEEEGGEESGPTEQSMEEEEDHHKSDNFENIGDDDISSDDDFIDVPNLPISKLDSKQQKRSVKPMDKKSSVPGLEKNRSVSKKATKKTVSGKINSSGIKDNQKKTKYASSKSSSHKLQSKGSSHKLEKTGSSSKLSSPQKKAGQSSSSSSLKNSSSSASGHREKSQSSDKTPHSSKQSAEQKTGHRTSETLTKSKTEALKSKHTDRPSSNKSISKTSSSDKMHVSSKHASPSTDSRSKFLPDGKNSSSSSRPVSDSSSERRLTADGKQNSSTDRRSSCESVTSKDGTVRLSNGDKHQKMDKKNLTSVNVKYSDSNRKNGSSSSSTKVSIKHSDSKANFEKLAKSSADKHKVCTYENVHSQDNRQSSSSSSKRGGELSRSSSSASIKTSSRAGDQSKDRTAHSNKVQHSSSKSGKEGRSSHPTDSQKIKKPSSGKDKVVHHFTKPEKERRPSHSDSCNNSAMSITSTSSQSKKQKQSDSRSDSHKKSSKGILERMNSRLFGNTSDDVSEDYRFASCDDNPTDMTNDSSDISLIVEEEEHVDYSHYIHDSDLEEEDTFDECLKIFKETPVPKKVTSQPNKKLAKDQKKDVAGNSDEVYRVSGKKRIAHKAAEEVQRPKVLKKERPRHVLSPQEQMHNRIMMMQQRAQERLRAAQLALQEQEVSSTSGSTPSAKPSTLSTGVKKRVAHVPKASPFTSSSSSAKSASANALKKTTIAGTASKTEKRMAHTPNVSNMKRPMIPASFGSKVPSNIRQRYLNLIIDECLKFCPSEEKAYKKGLEEETGVYDRSNNKNIYLRVAVNTILRLRTEARESMPGSSTSQLRQPSSGPSQSHEATLGGARAAKTNFTLQRNLGYGKKTEVVLTVPELFQRLMKYSMTEEQLVQNGYPRPCPDTPGKAVIQGKSYQQTDTLLKDNERTCARCGKRFIVNGDGSYVREEECVYHWTRAYPRKKSGFIQHIYNCCNSDTSIKGCQVAGNHVHDRNKRDDMFGFMRTMPRSAPRDGNFGIFALDCEMVYTIGGLELARVTVVNTEGESVFESLVRPFKPIVDYNTRFSGLTKADLKDVETTLTEVQAVLLNLFSDKTVLIGHSLESDLFALKLIHSTVVDTSVVFPHRLGPPYKRALKNLMLEIFQKIIQCEEGGHDSKEDAVACLQLMKWRLKEDIKREARYSRD